MIPDFKTVKEYNEFLAEVQEKQKEVLANSKKEAKDKINDILTEYGFSISDLYNAKFKGKGQVRYLRINGVEYDYDTDKPYFKVAVKTALEEAGDAALTRGKVIKKYGI